jgi:hypothetical protein
MNKYTSTNSVPYAGDGIGRLFHRGTFPNTLSTSGKSGLRNRLGEIMRKLALLLAAALLVSAPIVATAPTDTYAAAKAKQKAKHKAVKKTAKKGGGDPNTAFFRAAADLGKALWEAGQPKGGKKAKRHGKKGGKKARRHGKKGKKTARRGGKKSKKGGKKK